MSAPSGSRSGSSPTLASLRGARARVAIVTFGVAGLAILLGALLLPGMRRFESPYDIPWWLVALGFFAAEWKVLHVHFRRETHAFSMNEVPVVAGLFLLTPVGYLAADITGGMLALIIQGRRSPLKMAYNLSHFALIGIVTLGIFQALTDHLSPPSLHDWLAAILATSTADLLAGFLVATVITASGGAPQFHKLPEMIRFGSLMTVSNTSISLLAITVMWQDQAALGLLALPLLALFLVYRAYLSEREKHQRLELLYQSSRIMQHSPELDSAIVAVLDHAREMFRAEVAEILLFPQPGTEEALRTAARSDGAPEIMAPVSFDPADPLVRRTATEGRAFFPLDAKGQPDTQLMLSPLAGDSGIFGMMRVSHRLSAGTSFDTDDLRLLETLANQAAVALENGQLEQSLTELSRLKEQLRFLAYHDPLTSLPNRISLVEEIDIRLANAPAEPPTVLYIDLDDFKVVNDSLGHHAGDEILVAASDRIRNCLGPGDLAARLGGDEFAVLLTEGERFERSTATGTTLLRALRAPFILNGQEMTIGASIGIATGRPGQTADELLRDADVAMYAAKTSGKRRVARFDPSMHAALVARHTLSIELARGLERGELEVHYQPIVELSSGRITAIEALARWRHPVRGLVPPDEFIGIAEETGSIMVLGRIVLARAADQVAHWLRESAVSPDLRLTINVSPVELLQVDFVGDVRTALELAGLPGERLILEVTETVMLRDTQPTIAKLDELARIGVAVAVDDFGTGYSSLGYLRRFPVSYLKIAREFVPPAASPTAEADWLVAGTIVALGRAMRLGVVAEGIEERGQLDRLLQMGCEYGQGFLFLVPHDAAAIGPYLRGEAELGGFAGVDGEALERAAA
jgi:diguanylate cyclase (GGDEF)-like protein